MGALSSKPTLTKETERGEVLGCRYGVGAMQGWRRSMEDGHLAAECELGGQTIGLFGVFDGHGGKAVAQYVSKHLPAALRASFEGSSATPANVAAALPRSFERLDAQMHAEAGRTWLKEYECGDDPPSVAFLKQLGADFAVRVAGGDDEEEAEAPQSEASTASLASATPPEVKAEAPEASQASTVATEASTEEEPAPLVRRQKRPQPAASVKRARVLPDEGDLDARLPSSSEEGDFEEEDSDDDDFPEGDLEALLAEQMAAEEEEDEEEEGEAGATHARVRQMAASHGSPEGMGATATVLALLPPEAPQAGRRAGWKAVCANAGDSRTVLCRAGKAVALSEDHKPDDPIERARIYAAGGNVVNGRVCENLNLSRALGDFNYKDFSEPAAQWMITCVPDVVVTTLTEEDEFLLLGCDGIWETFDRQKVVDFVRSRLQAKDAEGDLAPKRKPRKRKQAPPGAPPPEAGPLERIACEYLDLAMAKDLQDPSFDGSGCDNMTLAIVLLKDV